MKSIIIAAALLSSPLAQAASQEELCLTLGKLAEAAAQANRLGITEKEANDVRHHVGPSKAGDLVVSYVFTIDIKDPGRARQMVYLKCMAGDFGSM